MKTKIILQATMCVAALGLASTSYALPPVQELVATGSGDVTVTATFLSADADNDDQLFLYDVKNGTYTLGTELLGGAGTALFDNHSSAINSTFNLGSFAAGDELVFELKDLSTGFDWFSGSDTGMNLDLGRNHFDVTGTTVDGSGNPTSTVGVEDQGLGGDYDYNDLVFSFSGVSAQTVPDAAGTMSLLGLGLTGLMAVGRRFRK